jgi:TolA-binding protein
MNRRSVTLCTTAAIAAVTILLLFPVYASGAKNREKDFWNTKENLTMRLSAEWHKISLLHRESESIADVLTAIRSFELYPPELTGFDDRKLVDFDKSVEIIEKQNRRIAEAIEAFKAPLTDAIAILREMVTGEPVASMFSTLEKGDLKRINEMLSVKHSIDTLWQRVDTLMSGTMQAIGMPPDNSKDVRREDEFFTILKANLGLQSEAYYTRLNRIISYFLGKASSGQIDQIVRIELHQIQQYLSAGQPVPARRKIADAIDLFGDNVDLTDLYTLQARAAFMSGSYPDVLAILDKLPDSGLHRRFRTLHRLQCLYALHEYAAILADSTRCNPADYRGSDRNLILWINMESALALQEYPLITRFAAMIEKGKPFSLHVMHALSRSYLAQGDAATALSILEQAQRYKTTTEDDRVALKEIKMAVAQLYYERADYNKSIDLFYKLLNDPDLFERALFGISWCYLQSGQFDKAETALRKLINQAPESAWGAEGILVLARRYLQKAEFAWKKQTFVEKEKNRLSRLLERLDLLGASDRSKAKSAAIQKARIALTELLGRVEQEKLADYPAISSLYDNVDRLCSFITSHYYTGTFQEAHFSKKRERILTAIDSIRQEIERDKHTGATPARLSNALQKRLKIKSVVDKADVFSAICLIDRYRWERDYIDWRKNQVQKGAAGAGDTARKTDTLATAKIIDALLLREDSLNTRYSVLLRDKIQYLLLADLDSADACYLKYQLGELYYKAENALYAAAYESYEKKLAHYEKAVTSFHGGSIDQPPEEPAPPVLNHDQSMAMYRAAMSAKPSSPFTAAAQYSLAWCYNDLGQYDSAYANMSAVATQFPDNPHTPQAWMFCGEYLFDKGNLKDALTAFYTVMKYPECEWFDEALYKVAWTQYRLSNPEKAISSFLALVDLGGGKFGHSLLEKESMDYIAISFSETDATGQKGLRRAAAFAKKLGDPDRGCQILHRLAKVFQDQGRYDMAKKTYSLILSSYPAYAGNPLIEAEYLTVLDRDNNTETSIGMKYEYFKKYNHQSAWAHKQPDSIAAIADSTASKMLYDAAISYHQLALQKNSDTLYHQALATYTDYVGYYPQSPLANECHYNLAEIQFSLGNYRQAAEAYIAVSRRYPDSKYRETAAWNAIVASQNLLRTESGNNRESDR